tara:strand:+ start:9654 stop:10445 length:792 start_codon:yes stop_codon:yes gene_type:complete
MKNIALIEARYDSTRLKGKVLLNLNHNFKTIDFVIQNLLASKKLNNSNIYLLTSKKKSNHKIIKYVCTKYKIGIYRGAEENVYLRIYNFIKNKKIDNLIRVTSDNPLIDPMIVDRFIGTFERSKVDYMSIRSMEHTKNWNEKSDFPEGISLEVFKKKGFLNLKNKINKKNYSYPTWYFYNSTKNNFLKKKFEIFGKYKKINKKMRVTLDTRKDFDFLKKIINFYNLTPGKNNILKIINFGSTKKNFLININKNKKIAHKIINS